MDGVIKRDAEVENIYISLLNSHFKNVIPIEKYISASMNLIISGVHTSVLGNNFQKKKISRKNEKKIKELITKKIKAKYGEYANLSNFKVRKNLKGAEFKTNINLMFMVPGYGKLYGCNYHCACGNIFLTQHCIDRFKERCNPELYEYAQKKAGCIFETVPSTYDVILMLIINSYFEYGRSHEYFYLCIATGIFVIEDFGDVFIVKTFLAFDMMPDNIVWYKPKLPEDENINSFAEIVNKCECERIEVPTILIKRP